MATATLTMIPVNVHEVVEVVFTDDGTTFTEKGGRKVTQRLRWEDTVRHIDMLQRMTRQSFDRVGADDPTWYRRDYREKLGTPAVREEE